MERNDQREGQGEPRDEGSRTEEHLAVLQAIAYLSRRVERFRDKPEEAQAEFLRRLGLSASDSELVGKWARAIPELLGPEPSRIPVAWPTGSCEISWFPNVLAPVFFGIQEFDTSDRAPVPLRVFYPSIDGAILDAPVLSGCGRYPWATSSTLFSTS